ncbi:hypothetical protein PsYK624_064940 [Phanerochaete sordida]|uniref:Protein kinase domain-containing protein n=1 Tax=Phanerochaete sordida TaxID=48140 RepID=A0A9P3G6U7_9APHY|nr:hypothetical protein PsYK624_064940 [Phanerochaete sordida]
MDLLYFFEKLEQFFSEHLPGPSLTSEQLVQIGDFKHIPYDAQNERKVYAPFIGVVKALYALLGLEFTIFATGDRPESGESDMKPDACVYSLNEPGHHVYTLVDKDFADSKPPTEPWEHDLRACTGRTAWAWMKTLIEFKTHKSKAPFVRKSDGTWILANSPDGRKSRAQMAKYAAELQARQHRKFVFTVFVWRHLAWFMRWDRAGCIVSEPVDYIEDPAPLLNFLYRLALLDDSAQGYDTSVTRASQEHIVQFEAFANALEEGSHKKQYALHALGQQHEYPIHAVHCPDVDWIDTLSAEISSVRAKANRTRLYLIGRLRHGSRSPTGRGGKGFIAYDVDRHRLVWMKDYWCAEADGVHPELSIYKILKSSSVRYVATAIAGGDVGGGGARQLTITQDYLTGDSKPARRFHHRLIIWEVGRPLKTYTHGGKLVTAIVQALLGHKSAWTKAKILHRDVSMNNILINIDDSNAFLNDWDLCKFSWELGEASVASQHARSGTWPYMSGAILEYPLKPNELADDVESFVYVLSLTLLRFHIHSLSDRDAEGHRSQLALHVGETYDHCQTAAGGYTIGGYRKIKHMLAGNPDFDLDPRWNQTELIYLLAKLYRLGQLHYSKLDLKALQEKYGVRRLPQPVLPPDEDPSIEDYEDPTDLSKLVFADDDSESEMDTDPPRAHDERPAQVDLLATPRKSRVSADDATEATPRRGASSSVRVDPDSPTPTRHSDAPLEDPNVGDGALPLPQVYLPAASVFAPHTNPAPCWYADAELRAQLAKVEGDFTSHDHILGIFAAVKTDKWKRDKFADQFIHLSTIKLVPSVGSTGEKRPSEAGDDSERPKSKSRGSKSSKTQGKTSKGSKSGSKASGSGAPHSGQQGAEADVFGPVAMR